MAGSTITIPVAQFAQQLKQKYPQYASVADDKLVAAFVSKNPQYKANYQDSELVSVSFEPAATSAPAQKPGVTNSIPVQSPTVGASMNKASQPTVIRTASPPIQNPSPRPPAQQASTAVMDPPKATVVRPIVSASNSPSGTKAQTTPVPSPSSPGAPYLGNTVIVKTQTVSAPPMVGKYEIIDELARGGMGLVYKAFDPGIGRTVALKVMSEQLARDTDFRERFLREARGAGNLQHTNIVTVHELGEWQGAPFIAMEFLEGCSLEDILKNEKSTPLEKRLDIIAQACRGLDYAHTRGIVHRDIKPANVMVTKDGVAKIVDFGIARLADQKMTNTGHVLGTVSYMSPEQLQGRTLDGRSDIFAVGVMLFEALTSVLPFAAEDTGSAITNTLYRQPPSLSSFLTNYPKGLDEIISKCLAKDPAERFQTAGELADGLHKIQQELRGAQTAPTVIRSTPLPSSPEDLRRPRAPRLEPNAVVEQSTAVAKAWWKSSSAELRWAAMNTGVVVLLYLMAISIVWIPVAILGAVVVAAHLLANKGWWDTAPTVRRIACAVLGSVIVAFNLAILFLGIVWAVTEASATGAVVLALIATFIGTSGSIVLKRWKTSGGKLGLATAMIVFGVVCGAGALVMVLPSEPVTLRLEGLAVSIAALFAVFSVPKAGTGKSWWATASPQMRGIAAGIGVLALLFFGLPILRGTATPKSYFARGGEFERKEKARAAALAPDTSSPMLETLHILSGHTSEVVSVAFSPDGMTLASGDKGGTLKLWDSSGGQALKTIETHYSVDSLRFSPDGRSLIAATDPPPQYSEGEIKAQPNVRIWDLSTGQQQRDLDGRSFLAFNENGTRVAIPTAGSRTMFNVWDVNDWKIVRTIDAHGEDLSSLSIGQEGRTSSLVATASGRSDQITIWDTETGENHSTFNAQLGTYGKTFVLMAESSVAVARNRNMNIFSTLGDQKNTVWTDCGVSSLSLTRGMLAVGCDDGQVKFWRMGNLKQMRPLQAHTLRINAIATNSRTGWIATASDDKTVKIWKDK